MLELGAVIAEEDGSRNEGVLRMTILVATIAAVVLVDGCVVGEMHSQGGSWWWWY